MKKSIKTQLRAVVRRMYRWPLIGRFARIGVAVIRLPDLRNQLHTFQTEQVPSLMNSVSLVGQHQRIFETEHLPQLLRSLSDVNNRQFSSSHDRNNLLTSVPVALRALARDMADLRSRVEGSQVTMGARLDEARAQWDAASAALVDAAGATRQGGQASEESLRDVRGQIQQVSDRLQQHIATSQNRFAKLAESIGDLFDEPQGNGSPGGGRTDGVRAVAAIRNIENTRAEIDALRASVEFLLGRVEFVRRELMFELRYGAKALGGKNDGEMKATTAVLSPDKLATARQSRLRLNLGCGHLPLDGYLNVDRRALPGVDIVAEIDDLPFGTGEVDEISSAHLLEHFPQEQLRRQLLPYFSSLLKSGGRFQAVVPDLECMTREYSQGRYSYDDFREVLFGGQDYDGDFHYNMFTPQSLSALLEEAGFTNIEVPESGRRSGRCYEFSIVATKA